MMKQLYGIVWCVMLRHGTLWFDMLWCDMKWRDEIMIYNVLIWFYMIRFGDMIWLSGWQGPFLANPFPVIRPGIPRGPPAFLQNVYFETLKWPKNDIPSNEFDKVHVSSYTQNRPKRETVLKLRAFDDKKVTFRDTPFHRLLPRKGTRTEAPKSTFWRPNWSNP